MVLRTAPIAAPAVQQKLTPKFAPPPPPVRPLPPRDRFERRPDIGPGARLEIELPKIDVRQIVERAAYAHSLQGMSDEELANEARKQEERLRESSTGLDQSPEVKADALWRRHLIQAEMKRRELVDPNISVEKYEGLLEGTSDAGLKAEAKRLQAAIEDAGSGAHQDPEAASKLEQQLALVKSEQAQRVVDDPTTSALHYFVAMRNLTDGAVQAEQQDVRAQYDAIVKQLQEDPSSARKLTAELERLSSRLNMLDGELRRRGLEPTTPASEIAAAGEQVAQAATDALEAVTEPTETEPTEPTAPVTTEYAVQPGDTLGDIAWRISAEHGGTPDAQTVLNDILRLNPMPNPDLIEVGQMLQLPTYG